MAKKVNPKNVFKNEISKKVSDFLSSEGYTVSDGEDYGFTSGTIVVSGEKYDIQLKPIAPKAGIDRYQAEELEG